MKKAAFITLGCKVNYYETEALQDLFIREGYTLTDFNDIAHVYVINTCTVTNLSNRKSRQLIRQARRRAPEAVIAVTGCYAQVSPEELSQLEEVDLIVGTQNRHDFPRLIEQAGMGEKVELVDTFSDLPSFERLTYRANRSRTRAFLKVQEGCEQFCHYCVVPLARGPARSAPLPDVLTEVEEIAAAGYREIVLTGIRLGVYADKQKGIKLAGLIQEIEKNPYLERIRLSSLEPTDLDDDLIDAISSSSKVCRQLHIPLQSGSDYILNKMNRPYHTDQYSYLIKKLRKLMPGIALGTDVMVGFPGEDEEHHRESYNFIQKINFSRLHVFRFSPRPRTKAANMAGQVPPPVREARWQEINELGAQMATAYRDMFLQNKVKVLVERLSSEDKYIEGLTEHYLKVRAQLDTSPGEWRGMMVWMKVINTEIEPMQGIFLSQA